MSNLEMIPNELLTNANGGAQTWRELSQFATQRSFQVTSTTGGHHLGWAHRAGHAIDVRTRGHSASEVGPPVATSQLADSVPSESTAKEGKSTALTNQFVPLATVFAADQPCGPRVENLSA